MPPESSCGPPLGNLSEMNQFKQLVRLGMTRITGNAAHAGAVGNIIEHIQMRKQCIALEDRVDVALFRGEMRDVLPSDQDLALVRCFEASNDAYRGGLAAAAGTEYCEEFPRPDGQCQAGNCSAIVIALADVVQGNRNFAG
jgi:hypothetical protein